MGHYADWGLTIIMACKYIFHLAKLLQMKNAK